MVKNFCRLFVDFTKDRTTEIINDIAVNNRRFKELTMEVIEKLNDIKNSLPEGDIKILEELEDVRGKRETITFEIIYRQGLLDGIKAGNVYNKLRNRDIKQVERFLKMHL